mmetsp:Transcript_220/g.404  ORF Transcript_220/g.404 Transcript_220/m.404 type:complete len:502 (+) Transcript_220:931-2436(+)
MELFNYLEGKNPRDRMLRDFDYNQLFGPAADPAASLPRLEAFLNALTRLNADVLEQYVLDRRVQEFLKIEDAQLQQQLLLTSLTFNQNQEPKTVIYAKLNVVDDYQASLAAQTPLAPAGHNQFSVQVVDAAESLALERAEKTTFRLSFKLNRWVVQKPREGVERYLAEAGVAEAEELTTLGLATSLAFPRLSSLLFFDYFVQPGDPLARVDTFRELLLKICHIEVLGSDVSLDQASGKTVVELQFLIEFEQRIPLAGEGAGERVVRERVFFKKTHKQVQELSAELGVPCKKIKRMDEQLQIQVVEVQLSKIFTSQAFIDRQPVIAFLTSDYSFHELPTRFTYSRAQPFAAPIQGLLDDVDPQNPLKSVQPAASLSNAEMDFDEESAAAEKPPPKQLGKQLQGLHRFFSPSETKSKPQHEEAKQGEEASREPGSIDDNPYAMAQLQVEETMPAPKKQSGSLSFFSSQALPERVAQAPSQLGASLLKNPMQSSLVKGIFSLAV